MLNKSSTYILDGLINIFTELGNYDSSIYYSKMRLAEDSTHWPTYYKLAWQYHKINDTVKALKCIEYFTEFELSHHVYHEKLDELLHLKKQLNGTN